MESKTRPVSKEVRNVSTAPKQVNVEIWCPQISKGFFYPWLDGFDTVIKFLSIYLETTKIKRCVISQFHLNGSKRSVGQRPKISVEYAGLTAEVHKNLVLSTELIM